MKTATLLLLRALTISIAAAGVLLAGLPTSADTIRIEETDITLVGEWFSESHPQYSAGTAVYVNIDVFDPGAYATFEFDGTGITWIGARTYNAGLFDWIVDEGTGDERSGTVNTYIPGVDRFTTELLADDLEPGRHTFKFISLGIHGETFQFGLPSETYIDAFDIVDIVLPGPDFNEDGLVGCVDVNSLVMEIVALTNNGDFDLTGDGLVNVEDLDEWRIQAGAVNLPSGGPYLVGDATLDGEVDGLDFIAWNANKFTSQAAWCSGDFNADGLIDALDFILWNAHKFMSSDGVSAVPEPGAGWLALMVMLFLGSARKSLRAVGCRDIRHDQLVAMDRGTNEGVPL